MNAIILLALLLQQPTDDRLIERLGSSELDEREAAESELLKRGAAAALEKAVAGHKDQEVRSRASRILKEIRRRGGAEALRKALTPGLVKDMPEAPEAAVSKSEETWVKLLGGLTGVGGTRRSAWTTRRDVSLVADAYVAGGWRAAKVDALWLQVADECGIALPREIESKEEAAGGATFTLEEPLELERLAKEGDKEAQDAIGADRAKAVAALRKFLSHKEEQVRSEALGRLVEHDALEAADDIAALLRDGSTQVQALAAWSLAEMGIDKAEKALVALAASDEVSVRATALFALGRTGGADAAAAAERALADPNCTVRSVAAEALAALGAKGAVAKLRALLKDAEACDAAVRALGALGASDAAAEIRAQLADVNRQPSAMQALGRLGDRSSAEALRARLDDIDPWRRQIAALALLRMGDREPLKHPDTVLAPPVEGKEDLPRLLWALGAPKPAPLKERVYRGATAELLARWGGETGVAVEVDLPEADRTRLQRVVLPAGERTLEKALHELVFRQPVAFVFDGAVKAMPAEKAREWWRGRLR